MSSSTISSPRPDDRGAQVGGLGLERLESDLELGVFLDRERVGRPELVVATAKLGQSSGRGRRLDRRCRGPRLGSNVERRLEGGRVLGDDLVVQVVGRFLVGDRRGIGGVGRIHLARERVARGHPETGETELAQSRELDEHALAQSLEPEARLQLGVIGGAKAIVRRPEPLARARGGTFGVREPRPV